MLELAWNLEERGFEVTTGEDGTLSVEPPAASESAKPDMASLGRDQSKIAVPGRE